MEKNTFWSFFVLRMRQFFVPNTTFFLIAAIFTGLLFPLNGEVQSNYFSTAKICSTEKLNEELKKKTLGMCWNFGADSYFRFESKNGEVYFEICLGPLPELYRDFITRFQDQFIKNSSEKFLFSYRLKEDGSEEFHRFSDSPHVHPDDYSYLIAKRRVFDDAYPQQMSRAAFEEVIKTKSILFYTGAGLSRASNVPTMDQLYQLLGLEMGERFLFSLEKALIKPREFASNILIFHNACIYSPPTAAHIALKNISLFKNCRIITENLDALHEASGISPYRVDPNHLRNEIDEKTLSFFDYIICIGLSHDDRGFLGWYKEKYPQGKIIAIDLQQPSYLGDEDFLISGDVQEILPAVLLGLFP